MPNVIRFSDHPDLLEPHYLSDTALAALAKTGASDAVQLLLVRWVEVGEDPEDSFVMAVLTNDLCEAVGQADERHVHLLRQIVSWLYCYAPSGSWHSRENVAAWRGHGPWIRVAPGS